MVDTKFETMLDQIDDELQGAEEYIKCAAAWKESMPEFMDTYLKMANVELEHATHIHDMIGKLLAKQEHHSHLHMVWDWQKERLSRWTTKIRSKMEAVRKG